MAKKSVGMHTGKIPLEFAQMVTHAANESFADGNGPMMDAVTPVTRSIEGAGRGHLRHVAVEG